MKKIMFNDRYGLNQAVLVGRKTKTRRIINAPENATGCELLVVQKQHREYVSEKRVLIIHTSDHVGVKIDIPYQVGDEVAVAQSYRDVSHEVFLFATKVRGKEYRAGWGNKMFVRADLMPHRIKITNVRVERLQDISDEDCMKEGIIKMYDGCDHRYVYGCITGNKKVKITPSAKVEVGYLTPQEAFAYLIDKVSGKGTWESNPYVFVYDFELIKQQL